MPRCQQRPDSYNTERAAYQRNGRGVEDPAAHRVDNLEFARQTDVGDERPQRAPLQARKRLGLGGRDNGRHASVRLLAHLSTQVAQVVDVLGVYRQFVGGR